MLVDARKMIEETGRQDDAALVLASMTGTAASSALSPVKLAEQYGRPA